MGQAEWDYKPCKLAQELKAWSTAMAQPVETTTNLNAQSIWMLLEMHALWWHTNTQTCKHANKQTDATKRIISPASRSIIKILFMVMDLFLNYFLSGRILLYRSCKGLLCWQNLDLSIMILGGVYDGIQGKSQFNRICHGCSHQLFYTTVQGCPGILQ